ncbi:caspase family protein [Oricola sp.]|uniref:caspase family protein n=1 Tax=Oricola sp. TaxID=1979950 RepID=UPI0025DB8DF7|nr:caspase family protein [Oricola sp.]MCI5078656.1 caspase family protein [Oricola sp.]
MFKHHNTLLALLGSASITVLSAAGAQAADIRDVVVTVPHSTSSQAAQLDVTISNQTPRIGENVAFCFTSDRDGFVSLYNRGTSGRIARIYPFQGPNPAYVRANTRHCVPGPDDGFNLTVSGPAGIESSALVWTATQEQHPKVTDDPFALSRDISVVQTNQGGNAWQTAAVQYTIIDSNQPATTTYPPINNYIQSSGQVYIVAMAANADGLTKTDDDARRFVSTMQQLYNVPGSNILLDEDAYKKDFENAFVWLNQRVTSQDKVLFFYSGHGAYTDDDDGDEKDGVDEFFVPMDIEAGGITEETIIRDDLFAEWVNSLPTDNVMSFIDACHSGGLRKAVGQTVLSAKPKSLGYVKVSGARKSTGSRDVLVQENDIGGGLDSGGAHGMKGVVIAAVQENQYALEGEDGGIFTLQLVEALADRQVNSLMDVFDMTDRRVREVTKGQMDPALVGPSEMLSAVQILHR